MQSSDLKVCLFPMDIKWGDKASNLDTLKQAIKNVHPQTDLLILPETFSTGFPSGKDKEEVRPLAERNTGATIDLLKELAKENKMAIAGSFIADSGGSLYNRAFSSSHRVTSCLRTNITCSLWPVRTGCSRVGTNG